MYVGFQNESNVYIGFLYMYHSGCTGFTRGCTEMYTSVGFGRSNTEQGTRVNTRCFRKGVIVVKIIAQNITA